MLHVGMATSHSTIKTTSIPALSTLSQSSHKLVYRRMIPLSVVFVRLRPRRWWALVDLWPPPRTLQPTYYQTPCTPITLIGLGVCAGRLHVCARAALQLITKWDTRCSSWKIKNILPQPSITHHLFFCVHKSWLFGRSCPCFGDVILCLLC